MRDEDAAKQFGLKPRTQAERAVKVAGAIGRLPGMRNSAGSYNLWSGSSSRDVWLTAYAVGFMQDARDKGFEVPQAPLDRSRQWLLEQVQQMPGVQKLVNAMTSHDNPTDIAQRPDAAAVSLAAASR